jgi:hypothetical protein
MFTSFLSLFLFFSSLASHGNVNFLSKTNCSLQVNQWVKKNRAEDHWRRQVDPTPNGISYRTNTEKFGVWLELHVSPSHIQGVKIWSGGTEVYTWNEGCAKKVDLFQTKIEKKKNIFTDSDLSNLMKKNKKGMIYIWSPGMVYSMDYYSTFKFMASKLDLPLTVLMDPYFDEAEGKKIAVNFKFPYMDRRVESVELLMRNIDTHYPETLVYSNGKLSDHRIVGVMTSDILEKEIAESLRFLKRSP